MTILVGNYQGATGCTGTVSPGARNLMSWYLGDFAGLGGKNLGIYNCRAVRGGGSYSLHAEGRAGDLGTPVGQKWSFKLATVLRDHSQELGIQCIIHNRQIWSSSGGQGWRPYSGVAAHFDHLHVELNKLGAKALTVDGINRTLDPLGNILGEPSKPATGAVPNDGILQRGDKGASVEALQRVLNRWYPSQWQPVDGDFGPTCEAVVKYFQAKAGLKVDGIAGPATLAALGLSGLR